MWHYATINQLICLSNMENLNAVFINDGMPQSERLEKLNKIAIQQMKVLENVEDRKLLTEGKDYVLSYKNNKKVGTAQLIVKGKGNYTKSKSGEFTIKKQDIGKLFIHAEDVVENAKANKYASKITIKDLDGGVLKAGTDYNKTLKYTYEEDVEVISGKQKIMRYANTAVSSSDIIPDRKSVV